MRLITLVSAQLARTSHTKTTTIALLAISMIVGCEIDYHGKPFTGVHGSTDPTPDSGSATSDTSVPDVDAGPVISTGEACRKLKSSEPVPARAVAISSDAPPTDQAVFTSDLFQQFKTNCGGCHVDTNLGGFHVTASTFVPATKAEQAKIKERLHSDNPLTFMPPPVMGGKPWSTRKQGDPIYELVGLLEAWFAAGSPQDLFYIKAEASSSGPAYALSKPVGQALSNIGSCMPNPAIVGKEASAMQKLDQFFAAATELPASLSQTDLVSYDSETLARNGVLSFAPQYPLFSDNARKMRHVRVPVGESIVFDKEAQELEIPANTRVYKTFLKKVIDKNGHEVYRKIETRLIVSRPDGPDQTDGTHQVNALFGTYAWNENETEAKLVTDPLRNGKPFRDRLLTYVTDEGKAQAILDKKPFNRVVALREGGVTRTYAIPGSDRCMQCHMGSHNRSFVLGLTPLQLMRRPKGEGGSIEDVSQDELGQLARLISYKLITGLDSSADILPLEKSQGDRAPRNDYELTAQGYMLGNCSHCHNPRGYPTQQNPVLRDLLRFFPDAEGGIFQFPLERVSRRITRGAKQDIQIPYITPSLLDLETSDTTDSNYRRKGRWQQSDATTYYLDAPWRSLIYRNVDSPYPYADDYALFPHMPMNAPGFDCRAPDIMGDWMVSIPARLRSPSVPEFNDPEPDADGFVQRQPYVEVKPGEHGYDTAVDEAASRLDQYHNGGRDPVDIFTPLHTATTVHVPYRHSVYCPDTSDIVDPLVDGQQLTPPDQSMVPNEASAWLSYTDDRYTFASQADGVPDHAHWVVTDITDAPGEWYPRRTDWQTVLADEQLSPDTDERQKTVVPMLHELRLTKAFRDFATTPQNFGLWLDKQGCDFSSQTEVATLKVDEKPNWFDERRPAVKDSDHLFTQSPGGMVFDEICVNCHGPKFDSRGRQADTLMLMTGGETRVANLRDGLFGPVDNPGHNRNRAFGVGVVAPDTVDDMAARYMAWMGLGGTQRVIPPAILSVVGTALVLGERRGLPPATESANMLSIAQALCNNVLARGLDTNIDFDAVKGRPGSGMSLIFDSGDAELWLQLCTFNNPPPVRIVSETNSWQQFQVVRNDIGTVLRTGWYDPTNYPVTELVGDQNGLGFDGVSKSNLAPWCVLRPGNDTEQAQADDYVTTFRDGNPMPYCPDDWVDDPANKWDTDRLEQWTLRGAINAGMAVFLYLDKRAKDAAAGLPPPPAYDHCEQLK